MPYFIGVFDTVAALGAPGPRRLLMLLGISASIAAATSVAAFFVSLLLWFKFWPVFWCRVALSFLRQ